MKRIRLLKLESAFGNFVNSPSNRTILELAEAAEKYLQQFDGPTFPTEVHPRVRAVNESEQEPETGGGN